MTDVLAVLSGFAVGLVSGLIGVGGGILLVPIMVLGFKLGQHAAQGTSLAAIIPTSIVGSLTHHRRGNLDGGHAAWMAGAGVVGAVLGSLLAIRLHGDLLGRLFGVFLLFSAYRLWPR